jgi:multisubunit Na+/H+ antiporter MnhG subunit
VKVLRATDVPSHILKLIFLSGLVFCFLAWIGLSNLPMLFHYLVVLPFVSSTYLVVLIVVALFLWL